MTRAGGGIGPERFFTWAAALIFGLVALFGFASPAPAGPVSHDLEIILDASGSMRGRIDGRTKIKIAEETLINLAEKLAGRTDLALAVRVYGHQFHRKAKNCRDSKLEIPFGPVDPARIKALLKRIKPKGYTPLAYSIGQTRNDFDLKADRARTVVLITDGLETCDGDPCRVARRLAADGIGVTIHVIGFGLKQGEAAKLKCLTEPSGGLLLEAGNAGELIAALDRVVKKALGHNLVVKALTGSGQPLWAHVGVYQAGTKNRLALHQGDTTKFSLPGGRYDIVVRDFKSNQVQKLTGVEVADDQVTERQAVFGSGRVVVIFKTSGGDRLAKGYAEIWRIDNGREKDHKGTYITAKPQVFVVPAGQYRLGGRLNRLGRKQIIDNVIVEPGKEVVREIIFGQARLKIIARDKSGGIVPAMIEISRLEDGRVTGSDMKSNETKARVFTLEPGQYRVRVIRQNPKGKIILEGIKLEDGRELTREAVFQ